MTDQELPEAPMIVLGETRSELFSGTGPKWFTWHEREKLFFCSDDWHAPRTPEKMEVIPHPRNDPRAVQLISEAKKKWEAFVEQAKQGPALLDAVFGPIQAAHKGEGE